jgi:predicted transcriptional regulator
MQPLTRAELKVMKVVWRLRQAAARDVIAAAGDEGWKPSTVKTLLRRLVEKGHLKAKRVGNSFLYEPAESAVPSLQRALDHLFENVHEEITAPLLMHLVKRSKLTSDDLAELRALLDRKTGRSR